MLSREVSISPVIHLGSIDISINPGKYGFETLEFIKEGSSVNANWKILLSVSRNSIHSVELLCGTVGLTRDWEKMELIEDSEFQQFKFVSPITTVFKKLKITYKEVE